VSLKAWAIVVGIAFAILIALGAIERHAGAASAVFQHQRDSLQLVVSRTQREVDSIAKIRIIVAVHDTVWQTKYHVSHDTVLAHLTDTLVVKQFVTVADSTVAACTLDVHTCDQQRAVLTQELSAISAQRDLYKWQSPDLLQRHVGAVSGLSGAAGLVLGFWLRR
jgi:hypothetical protein